MSQTLYFCYFPGRIGFDERRNFSHRDLRQNYSRKRF